MDFERIQKIVESAQNLEDYSSRPPFFGKDKWTVDPAKIVIRPPSTHLPTISEEEEEDIKESVENVIKTQPKISTKHIQFASYADVHMRCPIVDKRVHYPSKMIEELKQENTILTDDLLIAEKRIERLESRLKYVQRALIRARTIAMCMMLLVLAGPIIALSMWQ